MKGKKNKLFNDAKTEFIFPLGPNVLEKIFFFYRVYTFISLFGKKKFINKIYPIFQIKYI